MHKNTRKGLWRGVASLTCFTLSLSLILGNVLEANAGTIDTYLGTASEVFVSDNTEENPLYDKFVPPAEVLNADGSGNSKALIEAAIDLGRREVAEGSVLLKNENDALPLASGSNVTLLGIRSHSNLLGSSFGVKAQGAYISLEQALSQEQTDFANTIAWSVGSRGAAPSATISEWKGDEFAFEGAGFNLNPTMIDIYEKLGDTYVHYENEPAAEVYDPGEPSVDEIAAVDPAYDDPKWDDLLDQLTLEEAMYIFTFGGPSIPGADSIGTVETYMTENAGNGIAVNLNASKDPNAPWAISSSDPNGNWHPEVFANAPICASTFNPELMYELGQFTGVESLFTGINILWGPGLNTHRHAYNGRNGEYYSEDPVLSGVAAMEFAIGALDYGLVAAPKHFAFNDQESERGGVSPYMTEQRAREVELRAYQIAFEATKYDTEDYDAGMRGLMTSFSKIGSIECTTSEGLMTEILANEWGFIGYAVTDIYDDVDLWTAVLNSGTTCFDTRGQSGFYGTTTLESSYLFQNLIEGVGLSKNLIDGDANLQLKLKDAVHKNIYAWSVSNLMNRYNATTRVESQMTWWRAAYYAAAGVSALVMVGSAAMYVLSFKDKKKEEI